MRAISADDGLGVVGLAILMRVRTAHQRAVGVGQVALPLGRRRVIRRRLGRPAATPCLGIIGRLLALISRAGSLGLGARFVFQTLAGRIELGAQRLAPGQLRRQRLRIMVVGVRRLGLRGQGGDVGRQFGPQRRRTVIAHRADLRGIGVDLGAVDRHCAQPQQSRFTRQQQHVQERRLECGLVDPAEARDCVVVGMQVGSDEATAMSRQVARSMRRDEKMPFA